MTVAVPAKPQLGICSRATPTTVVDMFFLFVGVAVGLAVVLGPLGVLSGPINSFAGSLIAAVSRWAVPLLAKLPYMSHQGKLSHELAVMISVLAPGVVVLGLSMVARLATALRRSVAGMLVVLAVVALFTLPSNYAVPVAIGAVVLAALIGVLTGALVAAPLMTVATVVGAKYAAAIWGGRWGPVRSGALELAKLSGTGQPQLWQLALVIVGLCPIVAALFYTLFPHPNKEAK